MLKRVLDDNHTLIQHGHFPFRTLREKEGSDVYLGIGGNVGDVVRRFEHLFVYLDRSRKVNIVETSPILKNPPFGYVEQPDFYNAVLHITTHLTPKALLRYILATERRFKRKRLFKDGPRTLDIDILFYQNVTMESDVLTIPHPGWSKRASVLIPLSYMKGLK